MGMFPGVGDLASMGLSGLLIVTMARKGASLRLVLRMLFNVVLDTVVGSIPFLGNIFDLFYKANYRNLLLMREHYDEGKHTGSVWPIVLVVLGVLTALFVFTVWLLYWMLETITQLFPGVGAT